MWLLNTSTLRLRDFVGAGIPPYAILSHTWGDDEVTFRDMRKDREAAKGKEGYIKVQKCCEKALQDGFEFVWIDTCCIDKRSSAELSEAINSMYRWYQVSQVCYVYLEDVPSEGFLSNIGDNDALSKSRWFTRGWTLQELIAPRNIEFLGQDWTVIGVKGSADVLARQTPVVIDNDEMFLSKLAEITSISVKVLRNKLDVRLVPAAQKMAWAARRQTTREEDLAYDTHGHVQREYAYPVRRGIEEGFSKTPTRNYPGDYRSVDFCLACRPPDEWPLS